jgi:ferrous iron transport protein B
MQLLELETGRKATIERLRGGRHILSRLAALGFTPGAVITIIRRSDHGPLLVSLRGSRVAIGQGEAAHISVSLSPIEIPVEAMAINHEKTVIALTGQPNVGKSSVFNLLTGMNQHVGNWTGKTIECKVGTYKFEGRTFSVVDLPGTYSLTASSEEERLARNFIIKEHPDLIGADRCFAKHDRCSRT